jgi:hypothetical protein
MLRSCSMTPPVQPTTKPALGLPLRAAGCGSTKAGPREVHAGRRGLVCLTGLAAVNLYFWWPIESSRSRIRTPKLGSFKQFWVADDVFDPKLPHHPLDIIRLKAKTIRMAVAELSQACDSAVRLASAGVWGKGRIGRLMNNALGSNIELVAPD